MGNKITLVWRLFLSLLPAGLLLFQNCQSVSDEPIQFFYQRSDLSASKKLAQKGESPFSEAADQIKQEADQALCRGLWTVVDKTQVPPSGNKHDYMSNGKYWWPDPQNPDGPYIQKDGMTNPHTRTSDKADMGDMMETVEVLGLAYYFFEEEKYAERAAEVLRVWFLNADTYMSPHMEFGQAIPNRSKGRPFGIIETRKLIRVVDAVQLIRGSSHWTSADQQGIENWFKSYLEWLLTSDHGKQEGSNQNNHETAYTFQVATYALFTENLDVARQKLDEHFKKSILSMIEPWGGMPRELARTKSLHYSSMNLSLMIHLCQLGDYLNLDLWNYQTPDGRSIQRAFDFLYPAWSGEKEWAYQQIELSDPDYDEMFHILRVMNKKWNKPEYEDLLRKLYVARYETHKGQLYWPLLSKKE